MQDRHEEAMRRLEESKATGKRVIAEAEKTIQTLEDLKAKFRDILKETVDEGKAAEKRRKKRRKKS